MQVMFADTLFFQTIGLEILRGDPHELATPLSVFLSQSKARELLVTRSRLERLSP